LLHGCFLVNHECDAANGPDDWHPCLSKKPLILDFQPAGRFTLVIQPTREL
jgi:hypothetical protein